MFDKNSEHKLLFGVPAAEIPKDRREVILNAEVDLKSDAVHVVCFLPLSTMLQLLGALKSEKNPFNTLKRYTSNQQSVSHLLPA